MRQSLRSVLLLLLLGALLCLGFQQAQAFTLPKTIPGLQQRVWTRRGARATATQMVVDPASILTDVASAPSTLVAAEAWVAPAKQIIEPVLDLGGIAFLIRIILSWYPQIDLNKTPANIIAWPTEPFLKVTRQVVPPAFGVDISPIIWFAFLNFLREILISDQGILTILLSK